MAGKSIGQVVGTLAGAVIGSFIPGGYVALGASIGGMVGGLIDPPKGPNVSGPRLSDLSVQTVGFGNPIPRVYGQITTFGTVFWVEGNKIHEVGKTKKSGKGGGGSKYTTYSYDATFAVSLCEGPIAGIRRIWIGGKLVFDGFASSTHAILRSDDFQPTFTLYRGTADQLPDPRIQADLGIANVSAWRGMAYIVFNNLPLEDFGNTLMGAQVKVELITTGITNAWQTKLLRDQDMPVDFSAEKAYITSLDNGVVSVNAYDSTDYYMFDLATGNLLGKKSGAAMVEPVGFGQGVDPVMVMGRAANGKMVYVQGNYSSVGVVGYGPYTPSGWEGGYLDTNIKAARVAAGWPSNYTMNIVCFNKGNAEIFLQTKNGDWYLIDLDGHILESHVTGIPPAGGAGFGMSIGSYPSGSHYCATVDMSVRRMITTYSFGVTTYSIGLDGSLTVITGMVPTIGRHDIGYAVSVYMDGNIIVLAERQSFQVIVFGVVSADPITLGEIVQTECLSSGLLRTGDLDVTELTDTVRGYKVAQPGQIRNALDPLRKAWPFDVVQRGYKIAFPKRGKTSAATIPAADLVFESAGQGSILTVAREMDSQLPRRIEVAYLDVNREYDQAKQSAERLNTDAINAVQVELPVVLDAGEAARAAEVLLYAAWLERADLSFTLPPLYNALEAGDVVTVVTGAAAYELRITGLNSLPDGRIEVYAKPNAAAIYTSSAVGQEGVYTGQDMALPGPADLLLLDVPCIDATTMNEPGLLVGLSPYLDAWKGGAIARSDDAGQTWAMVDSIEPPGTMAGVAETVLASGVTHIIDTSNTVDVSLHGGHLASVTESALFNGANHFAIGAHGRWEIIAAKTVVDHGNSRYTLSNLMRGRFGTEWAMPLHAVSDTVVLLDPAVLRFVRMSPSAINVERLWAGVPSGEQVESVPSTALTYAAVNLKPLSPIALRGSRDPATFDWTIKCTPRSRTPVEPFSGVSTPIGEASESYLFEIWDAGFTTLKRTLGPVSSPSVAYSQAAQISDFGGEPSTVYFKARQVSPLVGIGYAAQSSFYHYLPIDPYTDSVVLAMHFNGTNGSTAFTDLCGNTITAYGNTKISTSQSKFGGSSLFVDGTGDYLTGTNSDLSLGSGDFTIEMWVYPFAHTQPYPCLFSNYNSFSAGALSIFAGHNGGSSTKYQVASNGSFPALTSVSSIVYGSWVHLAVVRSGNTLMLFVNGVIESSTSVAGVVYSGVGSLFAIGLSPDTGLNTCFNGYIDDLRITRACRWTSNFTPPTTQFPDP